ncbi:5'-nucleotidase C-terminal domain-containing protein [uncultured Sulfurimonas sp.]|jgi:S-sulfosulfanyl-L-cysteine sulfohydrolase|uniref:bifunctional metallophosphatase/5'-nucleotidase n=1 Tax=uncultured Sulfurimonas sp. TaxID=291845 RepID=UPI0032B1F3F8
MTYDLLKKSLTSVLLAALLAGCGAPTEEENSESAPKEDLSAPVTISFIQLNDFHANLVSHNEQVRNENNSTIVIKSMGGIARLKTKIDEIRDTNRSSILMNIGDTYHGGAEAMFTNGNLIVDLVNELGIEIGVIGNWDFAYGPAVTHTRFGNIEQDNVKRPNFPHVAANAVCAAPSQIESMPSFIQSLAISTLESSFNCAVGELFLPATHIIEKDGISVGFIGLTSDIVDHMHEMMGFNLDFTQGQANYVALLKKYSTELKNQGADIVVVMSELGIHKDLALAKELDTDEVNIFFSAHTHELTKEALVTESGVYLVESGNDAYLGEMQITFDTNRSISTYAWQVHEIDESVAEDAALKAKVDLARAPFLEADPNMSIPQITLDSMPDLIKSMMPESFSQVLSHSLDEHLHSTDLVLDRRDVLESNLNNAMTDMLKNKYNTDVAITPGFRFDSSVVEDGANFNGLDYAYSKENDTTLAGEIHVQDVYRFFPAPYFIAKGNITGANLKDIIEQNLENVFSTDVFAHKGGWFDGFSGLSLELDITQAKNARILSIKKSDGSAIDDNESLSVIGCARPFDLNAETTLCSYNSFTDVENITNGEHPYAVSDFFIDEILDNGLSGVINRVGIQETSNTLTWPHQEYYQPLEGAK